MSLDGSEKMPLVREESSLQNKVVLLTGASKGLGLALSEALAAEGATLVLLSRSIAENTQNDYVLTLKVDVSDPGQVEQAVKTALSRFGKIDVLINNAALCGPFQLFQEHTVEDISYQIDVNLKGPMYLMQAVLPAMINQGGGDILNINSVAGKQIYPYCSVYSATKFALDAVTRTIAEEQRANHIRVMSVYPGRIDTPIWEGIEPNTPQDPSKMLSVTDVVKAILVMLKQPRDVEIRELVIAPTHCD